MAKTVNIDVIARNKASAAFKTIAQDLKGLGGVTRDLSQSFFYLQSNMQSIAQVGQQAFGALKQGAKGLEVREAFGAQLNAVGQSLDQYLEKLNAAAGGTITETELMQTAAKAMSLGVTSDVDKMAQLLEVARFKARRFGIDTAQAFNDISIGIGRASPLILDNLGILTGGEAGYRKYAASIGKTLETLTEVEKRQYLLNKVLSEGTREIQAAGGMADTAADKLRQLETSLKEGEQGWKEYFAVMATQPTDLLGGRAVADMLKNSADAMKQLEAISKGVSVAVGFIEKSGDSAAAASVRFRLWTGDIEGAKAIMAQFPGALEAFNLEFERTTELLGIATDAVPKFSAAIQGMRGAIAGAGSELGQFNKIAAVGDMFKKAAVGGTKEVGSVLRDEEIKLGEDRQRRAIDLAKQLIDIQRDTGRQLANMNRDYSREMASIDRELADERARISEEYAEQRVAAEREYQRETAQAASEFLARQAQEQADLERNLSKASQEAARQEQQEEAAFNKESERAEEDHQKRIRQIKQQYGRQIQDAIRARDGKALIDALRGREEALDNEEDQYRESQQRRKEDFETAKQERRRDRQEQEREQRQALAERQRREKEAFDKEQQQAEQAHRERLQALRDAEAKAIAEANKAAQKRRDDAKRSYSEQRSDFLTAQQQRLTDLATAFTNEGKTVQHYLSQLGDSYKRYYEYLVALQQWASGATSASSSSTTSSSQPKQSSSSSSTKKSSSSSTSSGTQQYSQAYASGTSYASGGRALVGEEGPELVDLPRGSRVYSASQTQNMLGSGGGGVTVQSGAIQVSVTTGSGDSREIRQVVEEAVGDALEKFTDRVLQVVG